MIRALSMSDLLYDVFGGWPNFTQGAFGAFLGVVGAYGVAVWTTRKEIRRDRARAREDTGVEAAGQLIRAVADLPARIEAIGAAEVVDTGGISDHYSSSWEKRRREVTDEVTEHGAPLPQALEAELTELIGLLSTVLSWDWDEDGRPVFVNSGPGGHLEAASAMARQVLADLQAYRRDPTGEQGSKKSRESKRAPAHQADRARLDGREVCVEANAESAAAGAKEGSSPGHHRAAA